MNLYRIIFQDGKWSRFQDIIAANIQAACYKFKSKYPHMTIKKINKIWTTIELNGQVHQSM